MAWMKEPHTGFSSGSTCFPLELGSECLILTERCRRMLDLIEYSYCFEEWRLANSNLRAQASQTEVR